MSQSQTQAKAKGKVVHLFQEYDIEYIDYNVRDDEYCIRLVNKDTKEEE